MFAAAFADEPYHDAPDDIAAILDAKRPPTVRISPDRRFYALLDKQPLPPIADLARPMVRVAGIRIDPGLHAPSRESSWRGLQFSAMDPKAKPVAVDLGPNPRIHTMSYSVEGDRYLVTLERPDGLELWVGETGKPTIRRLLGPVLNATYGQACDWLPGDQGLLCKTVTKTGTPPSAAAVPKGPRVDENVGRTTPSRTYPDLLETDTDVAVMEFYLNAALVQVKLDGTTRTLIPEFLGAARPSPDGKWVLIRRIQRPYSYSVPISSFPMRTEACRLEDWKCTPVADLGLADDVPITFGSVRKGRRTVAWRADRPASLWWVEALDGGDASKQVPFRDTMSVWDAPFTAPPTEMWRSELRFGGVTWGDDHLALLDESWWATRKTRTWRIDPSKPGSAELVWDRSSQDRYTDPGEPVLERGPYGAYVLQLTKDRSILLDGAGIRKDGVHPFLDRFDFRKTTRLWTAKDPYYESIVDVLDREGTKLLTMRESQTEPPNLYLRTGDKAVAVTRFADWAPAFARVNKEILKYQRSDGLPLSATMYLPPDYDPKRDGPRPTLFWVYPAEFKNRSDAGQVTDTPNRFSRPGGISHLFFLLRGWVVIDDPTLPIVGEGDVQPNDSYVQQLRDGAKAAVDAVVKRGVADPKRLVVGGHSYGAFTTANLLAHTDLFRAGIARSGAYNRTLTPFGFQGEERSFWEAPETYVGMSPFSVAKQVNEPLLLIHGLDDSNSGTWPIQSERMYEALKGLGATVRLVELPLEDHGYQARESAGHVQWEMLTWADRWTK